MMNLISFCRKAALGFLLMSVAGPFPWEMFPYCVFWAVSSFGNSMCGAYLGLLLVVVFPSSVLEVLPFSFWEKNFTVRKTRLTACISRFLVFSFLSPVVHVFCEIFLSMFLPYFLTMKCLLTGMLGESGACLVHWIFRSTSDLKNDFVFSLIVTIFPKIDVFTFYLSQ